MDNNNNLTKLRVTLDRQANYRDGSAKYLDPSASVGLELSAATTKDMDFPTVITITVEPGDKLNG